MTKTMKNVLCLLLCAVMVLGLAACNGGEVIEPSSQKVTYTVQVENQAGSPLENVGVYIYEDSTQAELVWYDTTDAAGQVSFTDVERNTYVAVLSDVPTGYGVEESYALTGTTTKIVLSAGTMTGDEEITYKLGDMVMDFTFTATDGKEYSLYGLLEQKQAVVLNFYFNGCVPCQMEFPHLQEAYEMYGDQVAVVAMNPVDSAEDVASFQQEHGLTFLMTACNPNWQDIMQVTAYPTTVVIDRHGNIVLRHTGSIDSAQTFKDVFAAVTGDDYEQKIYDSIFDVEPSAETGTIDNPSEMGATPKFEVNVPAGGEYYIHFYKLNNLTMQIKDPDVYVVYNNEKHSPKNGVLTLLVTCPDMNTPVSIGFGNSSQEDKTFTVTMTSQPGSLNNPYSLVLGENKVRVNAGNAQGVYYVWYAKENGTLKVHCTSATAGVQYDCVLYNHTSYAQRNMGADGATDENGYRYVEVKVNKGDKVQMIAAVLPDENWNYPAGNFTYVAQFTAGDGRDEDKVEKTTYTVTVTDEEGNGVANVNLHTLVDETATFFTTDGTGVATVSLPTGTYEISVLVPEGYTCETTEFTLSKEEPAYALQLQKKVIVMLDYTVCVLDSSDVPVAGVTVVIGDKFAVTNEEGNAVFNLEQGEYTVTVEVPEGFVTPEGSFAFPENETTVTVNLEYVPGTLNNPIAIYDLETVTDPIGAGQTVYYHLFRMSGMILTIDDADAVITVGEQVYEPGEDGKLTFTVPNSGGAMMPVTLRLTNSSESAEPYTIVLTYPLGHAMNPQVLENLGELTTQLEEGDEDGYYYRWTAAEEGVVTFYVASATEGVVYDISLTNHTNSVNRTLSADGNGGFVTLNVAAGDTVSIQVLTSAFDAEDQYVGFRAATVVSNGSFTAQENTEDAKLTYCVIVKDAEGNPMKDVAVSIGTTLLTTDDNGMAFAQLVEGTYTATVTVPEGYKAETNQFSLTVEAPQTTVTLSQIVMVDYRVELTYAGAAYSGDVTVQLLQGSEVVYEQLTNTGAVTVSLAEGDYTVQLIPADNTLTYDPTAAVLSVSAPTVTLELTKLQTYTDYKVTVTDMNGKAQSGIRVQIMNGDQSVAAGNTDANGQFTKNLASGEYTVKLSFSDTAYYYNKQAALLTAVAPNLTIRLAAEPEEVTEHWFMEGAQLYVLDVGGTHVHLGNESYYSLEHNSYFFMFNPAESGTYRISLDREDVPLRDWSTTSYPFAGGLASENEDNALHLDVKDYSIGNVMFVLAVEKVEGVEDVAILITREGDAGFDLSEQPWTEDWMEETVPTAQTVKVPAGKKINYIDIKAATETYTIVYNETDGYYHVGTADGPVLYMNLGTVTTHNISINAVINGDGIGGGAPIRRYFFDEDGKFLKKEDYTNRFNDYITAADSNNGLYPVTKELAYMIKNGCEQWWDSTSPSFLLEGCNPDLGWLFACCYID